MKKYILFLLMLTALIGNAQPISTMTVVTSTSGDSYIPILDNATSANRRIKVSNLFGGTPSVFPTAITSTVSITDSLLVKHNGTWYNITRNNLNKVVGNQTYTVTGTEDKYQTGNTTYTVGGTYSFGSTGNLTIKTGAQNRLLGVVASKRTTLTTDSLLLMDGKTVSLNATGLYGNLTVESDSALNLDGDNEVNIVSGGAITGTANNGINLSASGGGFSISAGGGGNGGINGDGELGASWSNIYLAATGTMTASAATYSTASTYNWTTATLETHNVGAYDFNGGGEYNVFSTGAGIFDFQSTLSLNSTALTTISSASTSISGANFRLGGLTGVGVGKVLTSDATGQTSWQPGVQTATLSLTANQIKALNSEPQQIIAAPGANKMIVILGGYCTYDYNTAAFTNTTPYLLFETAAGEAASWQAVDFTVTTDQVVPLYNNSVSNVITMVANKKVSVKAAADSAVGDGTAKFMVQYMIVDAL